MRRSPIVFALIAMIAIACAPSTPAPTSTGSASQPGPAAEKRSTNQVIRIAKVGLPAVVSPETSISNQDLFMAMYDSLIVYGPNYEFRPAVAERWEFRPAEKSWRFFLRKDMTFSNGQKLTAEDVAYSVNLIVTQKLAQRSVLPTISQANKIDDYTVDIVSTDADVTVLDGAPWIFVLPSVYHKEAGKDFGTKPIGSGPYELLSFKPGDAVSFKLRSAAHPYRKPIASELQFKAVPEKSAQISGLQTGDIDVTNSGFTTDQADQLKNAGVVLLTKQSASNLVIFSQPEMMARNTPLKDKRVRLALNYALNRDAIAKTLFKGYAEPVGQLGFSDQTFWDPAVKAIPYDPAMAKRLLAEAGYPNGFKLPLGIEYTAQTVSPDLALAVQSALRDIGVEADLKAYEFALYLDKLYGREGQQKGDLFMLGSSSSTQNFAWVRGRFDCNLEGFAVLWCTPEFNRLFDQGVKEPDAAKRTELLRKANAAFRDDVPVMYTVNRADFLAVNPKLRGVEFTVPGNFNYDNAFRVE